MNISMKQNQTHRLENTLLIAKGTWGRGKKDWELGLEDANCYIQDKQ